MKYMKLFMIPYNRLLSWLQLVPGLRRCLAVMISLKYLFPNQIISDTTTPPLHKCPMVLQLKSGCMVTQMLLPVIIFKVQKSLYLTI